MIPTQAAAAKLALRDQIGTGRRQVSLLERMERARAMSAHLLGSPEVHRAATVAAYVATGREPGTGPLLDVLADSGRRVILPMLLPDDDLDWAVYAGAGAVEPAPRGLLQPTTPPLGRAALSTADLVLVPGLAVDRTGARLGRGGGSYDRALARVPLHTPVWVVLNANEVLDAIPLERHDRRVTGVLTEAGVERFRVR